MIHAEIVPDRHGGHYRLQIPARHDAGFTTEITIRASTIPALCRALIRRGLDPAMPLKAWRGTMLCLSVRSIGKVAQLRLRPDGVGFRKISPSDFLRQRAEQAAVQKLARRRRQ